MSTPTPPTTSAGATTSAPSPLQAPAAQVAPTTQTPPQPQTTLPAQTARMSIGRPVPPILTGVTLSTFGRRDNVYLTYDYAVQIDGQNTVSGATFDQMEQLVNAALPITRVNFIRMWKSLILKRSQDIFEKEKHHRSPHFVRLDRSIVMPAPLSDLLYSMGSFVSNARGIQIHMTPPAQPPQPQPWWNIDNDILRDWSLLCHRMQKQYLMREMPSPGDFDGRPLALLIPEDFNNLRAVYSYTNEPTPTDALITFVNDNLFIPANSIDVAHCSYLVVDRIHRTSTIGRYVGSYVLESNS